MSPRRPEDSTDDLYERLGAARGADAREIRRRYLDLAARYHPDRHQGNPLGELAKERLAEINAAYEVLRDPARRAAYDGRFRSSGGAGHPGASHAQEGDEWAAGSPGRGAGAQVNTARAVITLIVLAASALGGLRVAPAIGRFFAAIFGSGPGRIVGLVVLAGVVVAIVVRSRARRSR